MPTITLAKKEDIVALNSEIETIKSDHADSISSINNILETKISRDELNTKETEIYDQLVLMTSGTIGTRLTPWTRYQENIQLTEDSDSYNGYWRTVTIPLGIEDAKHVRLLLQDSNGYSGQYVCETIDIIKEDDGTISLYGHVRNYSGVHTLIVSRDAASNEDIFHWGMGVGAASSTNVGIGGIENWFLGTTNSAHDYDVGLFTIENGNLIFVVDATHEQYTRMDFRWCVINA